MIIPTYLNPMVYSIFLVSFIHNFSQGLNPLHSLGSLIYTMLVYLIPSNTVYMTDIFGFMSTDFHFSLLIHNPPILQYVLYFLFLFSVHCDIFGKEHLSSCYYTMGLLGLFFSPFSYFLYKIK